MAVLEAPTRHTVEGSKRDLLLWLTQVWTVVRVVNLSGTTAQRPKTSLFIGMTYFDTTLNLPIWLQSANPSVWIKADGTVV